MEIAREAVTGGQMLTREEFCRLRGFEFGAGTLSYYFSTDKLDYVRVAGTRYIVRNAKAEQFKPTRHDAGKRRK